MNILFVHERFGALAGAEANALITASELKGRGHRVGVLHGPGTGRGEDRWEAVFEDRYLLEKGCSGESARRGIAEFGPDAIYVHKMADLEVLQACVDSDVPLVRMVHDHEIYCMRKYKYNYFTRRICTRAAGPYCVFPCLAFLGRGEEGGTPVQYVSYKAKQREIRLNRQFARMLVVTEYMREELVRNGFDAEKIEIHPPVPRLGDASIRSNFGDRNLVLYAGQIIRGKGVDVLLHALAKVKSRFECIILGDGNHREYCEQLSRKLRLEDRVTFKGFIPQDELKSYYRECSVVVLSSVWPEPIATIGLEVMRYGLPVVAFDAGGIKDWLKDGFNGYLVGWMDTAAFAGRVDELLTDKEKARRLGENGLKLVSERYDFEGYIAGLEEMFERVIASKEELGASKR